MGIPASRNLSVVLFVLLAIAACGRQEPIVSATPAVAPASPAPPVAPAPAPAADSLTLPIRFERHLGDLDQMTRRREVRALVVYSRSGFFYDKGHPRGINFEAAEEFQRYLNMKLKRRALKISVTFIPVKPDQLEAALTQGLGDFIVQGMVVTPERQSRVSFTKPIAGDVSELLVTGPAAPANVSPAAPQDLEIYVNPVSAAHGALERLDTTLRKAGKATFVLKAADPHLSEEDLLQMVNAGLLPATVALSPNAEFWAQVLPKLKLHPQLLGEGNITLAWATRQDSPQLNALLDGFIEGHRLGTAFGNTVFRRYLRNTGFVKDSEATADLRRFQEYVGYFKKYAQQYGFDYLLLAAQGYQESGLNQSRRSASGAVGIMQVIPKYAAARPIGIKNVNLAENNIHAGAKMLKHIEATYFNDDAIDALDKALLAFASYNAGPTRIARLRRKAEAAGLDPNQWFGNVDQLVAKEIGAETVQYVSNIYKYYVAYKLVIDQSAAAQLTSSAVCRN